jgi:hypothetical protein
MIIADEYGRLILTANDYGGYLLSATTDIEYALSFSQGGRG